MSVRILLWPVSTRAAKTNNCMNQKKGLRHSTRASNTITQEPSVLAVRVESDDAAPETCTNTQKDSCSSMPVFGVLGAIALEPLASPTEKYNVNSRNGCTASRDSLQHTQVEWT